MIMYANITTLLLFYKDDGFIQLQSLKRNNQSLGGCLHHKAEFVSN